MEVPLRTAYGQNGRCGMQPKAKHKSSRAGAAKTRTETCEIVEEKQKLLDIREKGERERFFTTSSLVGKAYDVKGDIDANDSIVKSEGSRCRCSFNTLENLQNDRCSCKERRRGSRSRKAVENNDPCIALQAKRGLSQVQTLRILLRSFVLKLNERNYGLMWPGV
ncbi:hypothetical protein TNCV_1274881 [Trichonephila clavipes]|nr:hypothetical protein TNCV_1274881 [Trichonephila clavipes]